MSNDWIELGPGVRARRVLEHDVAMGLYLLILAPHAEISAHAHPQDEAWYVLRGSGLFLQGGGRENLFPGVAMAALALREHAIVALDEGLELLSIAVPDWDARPEPTPKIGRECSVFGCPGPAKTGPRCGAQTADGEVCIRAPHEDCWHHARERSSARSPTRAGGVSEAELFASADVVHFTGDYRIRGTSK